MANEEHLKILKSGVENWNKWREENTDIVPDLSKAKLSNAYLCKANLVSSNISKADLSGAILGKADLDFADLSGADLTGANLGKAVLCGSQLIKANLSEASLFEANLLVANLFGANLSKADLSGANLMSTTLTKVNLSGANLMYTTCVRTNFIDAILDNASIYGISVWNVQTKGSRQRNLIITRADEPEITVDSIEVAQFIYLILNNQKLRDVINTITSKSVLILGRFTTERKKILDAIRDKLREYNFVPIMFDFEKADLRDFTETIKTLAGMSRFVIADITNPKSSPLELQATIPDYQIPFITIIHKDETPFSMFSDLAKYPWALEPMGYGSENELMEGFEQGIIGRAIEREKELMAVRQAPLTILDIANYKSNK